MRKQKPGEWQHLGTSLALSDLRASWLTPGMQEPTGSYGQAGLMPYAFFFTGDAKVP